MAAPLEVQPNGDFWALVPRARAGEVLAEGPRRIRLSASRVRMIPDKRAGQKSGDLLGKAVLHEKVTVQAALL